MSFWRDSRKAATTTDRRPKPIIRFFANAVGIAPSTSTLQRTTA